MDSPPNNNVPLDSAAFDLMASKSHRDAVVVVIERSDGQILFIRRPDHDSYPGYWNNVTGACEAEDVNLLATCIREVREEVGLKVEVVGKLWESTTSRASFVLHWFLARVTNESQSVLADPAEVSDWRWIQPDEVAGLGLAFADTREFFTHQFTLVRRLLLTGRESSA